MTEFYFITGTDTEIGKTWCTVKLARQWVAAGQRVACCKPLASGAAADPARPELGLINDDVEQLHAAASVTLPREIISPYRFAPAIAPHIAAKQAGVQIDLARIEQALQQAAKDADIVLIEGFGGWLAPVAMTADDVLWQSDIARLVDASVILVVGMRLGCINHSLLSARQILADGLRLHGWIANHIDPDMACHAENLRTLQALLPAEMMTEIGHSS
ncbi:MAG: dethiobiotin synthase [Gammaproteobacteria bacterium]|nr:dethiobiotin synthase [Gammaproteobacteria bacterium]